MSVSWTNTLAYYGIRTLLICNVFIVWAAGVLVPGMAFQPNLMFAHHHNTHHNNIQPNDTRNNDNQPNDT
jgi:hypothetical protein